MRGVERTLLEREVDVPAVLERRGQLAAVGRRAAGAQFATRDYVRALVLAWLAGRRPWSSIDPHLEALADVFKDYDPRRLRRAKPALLAERVCDLQCGNRAIHLQMEALRANLETLARLERDFGSLDAFAASEPPTAIARKLAAPHGPYKLEQVGLSIAREMLRSVGFELAKPTAPIRRLLGPDRLGVTTAEAGVQAVALTVESLAEDSGRDLTEVDSLLWMFCAPDQGDVCGTDPDCDRCRLAAHCREGSRRAARARPAR